MDLRKLFPALSLALLPFASNAQCDFNKDERNFEYVTQPVGPNTLQWKFSVGHNSDKYYFWTYVVQDGKRLPRMTDKDLVILEFTNGEKMEFHPIGEVPVNFLTEGGTSTTSNNVRIEVPKEIMQKLAATGLKIVSAVIDNRTIGRYVEDKQAPNIKEAATCVLNKRG
ncbi:hypothetical protein [Polluticoccus soli]|uniref:hypothetical protein n=1 Tax=Polluticoccus soli TaxID=3034150 RepID=UPI0023E2626A|nr:hypothetical protein [Flavipsychrobacter sp. JY13-12]